MHVYVEYFRGGFVFLSLLKHYPFKGADVTVGGKKLDCRL